MRSSLSIFSSSGRKRLSGAATPSRSSIGRASMRKGAVIPHHILWNIKGLTNSSWARHATRQGWGGREITARTRAHLKKRRCHNWRFCSASADHGGGDWRNLLRGSPLISQEDWPFVSLYPHTSPHRRIGFTARRPAGNMMMPDRCQTPEVPILQTSNAPAAHASTPAIAHIPASGRSNVARMWQTQGMKLVTSRRLTDQ